MKVHENSSCLCSSTCAIPALLVIRRPNMASLHCLVFLRAKTVVRHNVLNALARKSLPPKLLLH